MYWKMAMPDFKVNSTVPAGVGYQITSHWDAVQLQKIKLFSNNLAPRIESAQELYQSIRMYYSVVAIRYLLQSSQRWSHNNHRLITVFIGVFFVFRQWPAWRAMLSSFFYYCFDYKCYCRTITQ